MSELLRRTLGESVGDRDGAGRRLWRIVGRSQSAGERAAQPRGQRARRHAGGGRLTIETANAYLDEAYAAPHEEVPAGPVRDDRRVGHRQRHDAGDHGARVRAVLHHQGCRPGHRPWPQQVYGFIKQSNGHIKLYSEPGQGTAVKLYLPRLLATSDGAEDAADRRCRARSTARRTRSWWSRTTTPCVAQHRDAARTGLSRDGGGERRAALALLARDPDVRPAVHRCRAARRHDRTPAGRRGATQRARA